MMGCVVFLCICFAVVVFIDSFCEIPLRQKAISGFLMEMAKLRRLFVINIFQCSQKIHLVAGDRGKIQKENFFS